MANQAGKPSAHAAQYRARPPRKLYGEFKAVRNYVRAEAATEELLLHFRAGKHRTETLLACLDLRPPDIHGRAGAGAAACPDLAILTAKRLLLAHAGPGVTPRVGTHVALEDLVEMVVEPGQPTRLVLRVRRRELLQESTFTRTHQRCLRCLRVGAESITLAQGADAPARRQLAVEVHCGVEAICAELLTKLQAAKDAFDRGGTGRAAPVPVGRYQSGSTQPPAAGPSRAAGTGTPGPAQWEAVVPASTTTFHLEAGQSLVLPEDGVAGAWREPRASL